MAIDETRLANAIIKIDGKVTQLKQQLASAEKMRIALKTIRMNRLVDIDPDTGAETNERFEKALDIQTQEIMSDARRQEVFDKIVTKVEAIR